MHAVQKHVVHTQSAGNRQRLSHLLQKSKDTDTQAATGMIKATSREQGTAPRPVSVFLLVVIVINLRVIINPVEELISVTHRTAVIVGVGSSSSGSSGSHIDCSNSRSHIRSGCGSSCGKNRWRLCQPVWRCRMMTTRCCTR